MAANPKKETEEFLDERKRVSLAGGEALWTEKQTWVGGHLPG